MKNLDKEVLLDHYRHPRNKGSIASPDFVSKEYNPSCGDSVQFTGTIYQDTITAIAFEGKGCVISQATASLLSERIQKQPISRALSFDTQDVIQLLGFKLGPTRLKCALLPLEAIQNGIKQVIPKKQ